MANGGYQPFLFSTNGATQSQWPTLYAPDVEIIFQVLVALTPNASTAHIATMAQRQARCPKPPCLLSAR
jgi:hypothetical protein